MAETIKLCSIRNLEEEFPRLSLTMKPVTISEEWKRVSISIDESVKDAFDHSKNETRSAQKGVEYVKLIKTEEGQYHLLVHKNDLSSPLSSLIAAFVKCLERLDIKIESVLCPQESTTGAVMPREMHPRLKGWITWLANPSSIDWKDPNSPNLSHIVKFVDNVVTFGKQSYLSISSGDSRSAMYINSIQNILCRLFLMDRERWVKGVWHFIPRQFRKMTELKFHHIRLFESICITAETQALPIRVSELKLLQETLLQQYLDLSGSSIQHKLRRTSDELVKLIGKPALRILYDRLKIRRSIADRSKSKLSVKLATVLDEGVRNHKWCCVPYILICAVHRRNIFRELMNSVIPRTFREDPVDLPFGCKTMLELARYCKSNEDTSPPSDRELLQFELLTPIEVVRQ